MRDTSRFQKLNPLITINCLLSTNNQLMIQVRSIKLLIELATIFTWLICCIFSHCTQCVLVSKRTRLNFSQSYCIIMCDYIHRYYYIIVFLIGCKLTTADGSFVPLRLEVSRNRLAIWHLLQLRFIVEYYTRVQVQSGNRRVRIAESCELYLVLGSHARYHRSGFI